MVYVVYIHLHIHLQLHLHIQETKVHIHLHIHLQRPKCAYTYTYTLIVPPATMACRHTHICPTMEPQCLGFVHAASSVFPDLRWTVCPWQTPRV